MAELGFELLLPEPFFQVDVNLLFDYLDSPNVLPLTEPVHLEVDEVVLTVGRTLCKPDGRLFEGFFAGERVQQD